jgi:predicted dehydrogenase
VASPVPIEASRPVRWGIASTGGIAASFTRGLALLPDAEVIAVASRTRESADRFAFDHEIPHRHASYESMANDDDVDVVYIGTPHSRHCDDTLLYLNAGKHVLCEKPFALNEEQATRMADAAQRNQRFLMEAIWSRFLPAYVQLRHIVSDGRIGDVAVVEASFGFRAPFDPAHRLFALELGGGALLDVGLYPVQLAHMLLGEPDEVTANAEIGETGVDEQIAVVMSYDDGPMAVAMAAVRAKLASTARIGGRKGIIVLPAMMHHPQYLEITDERGAVDHIDTPAEGNGLHYQAEEVHRCLRAGRLESAVMPLADSRAIARTLDRARADIGLRYPGE